MAVRGKIRRLRSCLFRSARQLIMHRMKPFLPSKQFDWTPMTFAESVFALAFAGRLGDPKYQCHCSGARPKCRFRHQHRLHPVADLCRVGPRCLWILGRRCRYRGACGLRLGSGHGFDGVTGTQQHFCWHGLQGHLASLDGKWPSFSHLWSRQLDNCLDVD